MRMSKAKLAIWHMPIYFCVLTTVIGTQSESKPSESKGSHDNVLVVADSNWTMVLEGEWMVEFMAPWCPACRAFKDTWSEFAGWSHDLDISVGVVDVTENPGLSGRFLISSLPSMFHIKNGIFRQYYGGRKTTDLIAVIVEKKWEKLDPVAWYRDPNSFQMSALGFCFKAAMYIRAFYTAMVETYGIPEWACYLIFAILTIITGLLLGLLIVVFCDNFFPAKYIPLPSEHSTHIVTNQDDTDLIDDTEEKSLDSKGISSTRDSPLKSSPEEVDGPRKRLIKKDS